MKKGILVYDKADAEYNKWFINKIIVEGAKLGLDIKLLITEELAMLYEKSEKHNSMDDIALGTEIVLQEESFLNGCDFAIMRNRKAKMSERLEARGIRCFNSSYVCRIGNDKWEMYKDFSNASIPVMYTQESKLPYPFVMKPRNGHGGQNVFLVNNKEEYENIISNMDESLCIDDFIYQFVATERGRDIRVYVVGNTILTAMERKAGEEEFRANFSLGGSASEYALNDDELKLAAKVADRIKADFVGIDIIYNNGKPIVNEIEDAVGTRMLYSETDIDAVAEYVKWIVGKL